MKKTILLILGVCVLMIARNVCAQGTAFTYQGLLDTNGAPASGVFDMSLSLYETNSGGSAIAGPDLITGVGVTNGLFMVNVEFYEIWAEAQIYETFWLDISVRPTGGGSLTELAPRQLVSPSPFAVFSEFANNANNVPANSITVQDLRTAVSPNYGQVLQFGSSGELTWTNLPSGGGGGAGWSLTGNAGTSPADGNFVGTTDDNPLALEVNGQRALLLVPNTVFEVLDAPNLIGGSSGNTVTGVGGTIAGGGAVNYYTYNTPENAVSGDFGTISGGAGNAASFAGTVGGGFYNTASANFAMVGGGYNNLASGPGAFVGGGGYDGGGYGGNQASGGGSVVVGGMANVANGAGSFIGGGGYDGSSVRGNTNTGPGATIAGGLGNNIGGIGDFAFIGGGVNNSASNEYETVSGGSGNAAGGEAATVAGGEDNNAIGDYAFVGAGSDNFAAYSATVAGGTYNNASGMGSFIGGGGYDGGAYFKGNVASGNASVVAGGFSNSAASMYATVSGGASNSASYPYATVSGGVGNTASYWYGTVGGGMGNTASYYYGTVGGGTGNTASGQFATVPGGSGNTASGLGSFAAGANATASDNSSFVWGDGSRGATSQGQGSFTVLATGGIYFFTGNYPDGAKLAPADSSWGGLSDRNAKKNFKDVDAVAILDKLATIPIQQWLYKWQDDTNTPNIGPMAQDFVGAFYPGRDNTHITTMQFDGVELAAIQGLNQKLEQQIKERDAQIAALEARNESLEQRLERIERMLSSKQ